MCNQACEKCSKSSSRMTDLDVAEAMEADADRCKQPGVEFAEALVRAVAQLPDGLISVVLENEPNGFPILTASWHFMPSHGELAASMIKDIGVVRENSPTTENAWRPDVEIARPEDFSCPFVGGFAHLFKALANPALVLSRLTRARFECSSQGSELVVNRLWNIENTPWRTRLTGLKFFRRS